MLLFLLAGCSSSDDSTGVDNPPIDAFEPVDLSLLMDTAGDGTIKLMRVSATTDQVSITDLSGVDGLDGQCLMDFSETDELTWIDANNPTYPIFQYNIDSEGFSQVDQMCALQEPWIRSINYSNGIYALSFNFNDMVNSQINARVHVKGGPWDCTFFEVPESNALQSSIVSNRLLILTNAYTNQNEWRLSIIDLTSGNLMGTIEHFGMARYFTQGDFLYIMNNEGFLKYDLITLEQVFIAPITYYIEENFGFNETRFHNNHMYIQTGFPQPSPYSHGITVLDTDTGEVVNATSFDFYANLELALYDALPNVFNFSPTSVEYLPNMDVIILATKDAASGRNFIIYTNFDAEILHTVEIPNPALKIYIR